MYEKNYQSLAVAIILQAVSDYKKYGEPEKKSTKTKYRSLYDYRHRKTDRKVLDKTVRRSWFRSKWCRFLLSMCDIDEITEVIKKWQET